MSLKSQAVSSVGWKLLEKGGSVVVKLVVQIVMARVLAPDQFGMLAIMLVFVNVGNTIVQSGLNTALVQDPDVTERDYSTVFWLSFVVSLVLYAALFVSAPAIEEFYNTPGLTWPLRALGFILFINAYNAVQIGKITRDLEMRKIFAGTVISSLASSALGVGSALAGCGIWALVIQQLSYQAINVLAHAVQVDWRPRLIFDPARARTLYSFGWKLLVSGLLSTMQSSLMSLIVGKQFSDYQLGIISQGEKYPAALGSMLDGVIQPVMLSTISKVQDDVAYARRIMRRALKTSTYLVVPVMCLASVMAPTLVPVLLGEQWIPSVPFFRIFCIVNAMLPMHTTNLQALVGMGQSGLFFKLEVIKTVVSVFGVVFASLVLRDVYILAGTYILAGLISTFVNARPNKRVLGYAYLEQVRDIAPTIGLSVLGCVAAQCVCALPCEGFVLFALQAIVFAALYLGVSALIQLEEFVYLVHEFQSVLYSHALR
ncbi:lipopolysaccharide biosynthesis protein [Collinsella tanakaei]|nr:lipopolysaccharide biosynthesis protein [Collinsella tanakaei]